MGAHSQPAKHPDCEDRCQLLEHKGYHTCSQTGRCEFAVDDPRATPEQQGPIPEARAFENWWMDQRRALEMSDAIKFAAWNGWLARSLQSETGPTQAERDVLTLCLRLCLEPADSHSPDTLEVLDRYRPQWEAAAGGKIEPSARCVAVTPETLTKAANFLYMAWGYVPEDTRTECKRLEDALRDGERPSPSKEER